MSAFRRYNRRDVERRKREVQRSWTPEVRQRRLVCPPPPVSVTLVSLPQWLRECVESEER